MDFDNEHEEHQSRELESGNNYRYKQCMKNHAAGMGGQAVDGCGEFIAAGEDGTLEALKCAACNCHRNFHRKVVITQGFNSNQYPTHHHHHHHPSGYLHITPPPPLPPPPREDENMSNPSSSGGRGGGGVPMKRHRTRFNQEQKDKMLAFAQKLGWRFHKQDEDAISQFCNEINVNRQVFKVWMHNNKQSMGKNV